MSRCRAHARREGFTIIELIVVMVIAAIAVMMAAPTIGRGLTQTRAQQAAATIAQDLQRGLSNAARTRRPVAFRVHDDSMVYHLVDLADGTVYATQFLGAEESEFGLSSVVSSQSEVVLMPNGTAASPLTITIQAGENRRRIRMMTGGLVRVEGL